MENINILCQAAAKLLTMNLFHGQDVPSVHAVQAVQAVAAQVQLPSGGDNAEPRENLIDADVRDPKIILRASQKSINFQLRQYLGYIRKVREAGIEPKELLTGLEIAHSGPDAPPFDFWCLITVRDRIIVESNAAIEQIKLEQDEALKSLGISGPIAVGFAAVLKVCHIPKGILLAIPGLWYGLYTACNLAAAWQHELELKSIVEKATNWELDEQDKNGSWRFWRYHQ
ncbi:hypothetical protein BDW71DRAFT_163071 [Aspergillus fruticulosus]